jgi:hypothetical protein
MKKETEPEMTEAAKIELKARFFELCEDAILRKPNSKEEHKRVAAKMVAAGMVDIVTQELDNIYSLFTELGYLDADGNTSSNSQD